MQLMLRRQKPKKLRRKKTVSLHDKDSVEVAKSDNNGDGHDQRAWSVVTV